MNIFITITDIIFCSIINFYNIFRNIVKILKADNIVFISEGGHGHTVTVPYVSRKLLPGNILIFFLTERKRHNLRVEDIWDNVGFKYLYKNLIISNNVNRFINTYFSCFLIRLIFRDKFYTEDNIEFRKYTKLNSIAFHEAFIYEKYVSGALSKGYKLSKKYNPSNQWIGCWSKDIENDQLANIGYISLPTKIKKIFYTELKNKFDFCSTRPLLTVYIRRKGSNPDSYLRNGCDIIQYVDIIKNAHQKYNALVCITGDVKKNDFPVEIRGQIVCNGDLRLDSGWFSIACVVMCDRFIGDPGGGSMLACLLPMPKIIVNAFPLGQTWPGSLLLYKNIRNKDNGENVPIAEALSSFAWTHDLGPNYHVVLNTTEQVKKAVTEFFEIPKKTWLEFIYNDKNNKMPMINGSRLSKVYEDNC